MINNYWVYEWFFYFRSLPDVLTLDIFFCLVGYWMNKVMHLILIIKLLRKQIKKTNKIRGKSEGPKKHASINETT